jgi:hypothetical protein
VPIVFSGYEVGAALPFPAASIERDYGWTQHHPVAEAYRRYMEMPYDRPTWDLTAVLEAVRPGAGYFRRSAPGRVTVSADGDVDFAPDNAGPHQYLILNEAGAPRLLTDMIALCAHRPRDRGGVSHARVAEAAAHPEVSSPATSVQ